MFSNIFGCYDVSIKVETNNKELFCDLLNLYGNYYCDNNQENAQLTIRYLEICDLGSLNKKNYLMDKEENDCSFNYLHFSNNVLTVFFEKYDEEKINFMQRILINAFIIQFQKNGYVIVHGSCFSKNNRCFIISGNKGAGKTTTLLKFLYAGFDFISNDKVAIKKVNDQYIACGIPHSMGILLNDLKKYNFDVSKGRIENDKFYFRICDLLENLNVNVYNKSNISAFLFPKYMPESSSLIVSPCNSLDYIGTSNILNEAAIAHQKAYLIDLMKPIQYENFQFINEICGYSIIQNDKNFDELNEFIDTFLNSKKKHLVDK